MRRWKKVREQWVGELEPTGLFHRLFDHVPGVYFFAKNREGHLMFASAGLLQRYQMASEFEILGRTDFDLNPDIMAQAYVDDDRSLLAGEVAKVERIELWWDRQGMPDWFVVTKLPVVDKRGQVAKGLGSGGVGRRPVLVARWRPLHLHAAREGVLTSNHTLHCPKHAACGRLGVPWPQPPPPPNHTHQAKGPATIAQRPVALQGRAPSASPTRSPRSFSACACTSHQGAAHPYTAFSHPTNVPCNQTQRPLPPGLGSSRRSSLPSCRSPAKGASEGHPPASQPPSPPSLCCNKPQGRGPAARRLTAPNTNPLAATSPQH